MDASIEQTQFQTINRGYNSIFQPNKMSVGLVVPIENYAQGPIPSMNRQIERIQLAEQLGFSAVWLRDVPFNVPSFGDAGQTFDPWVYLGMLAGLTEDIALGVASIILPLRHPAHVAKAAASVDVLSGGRLILGVASGDRPDEYPAMNLPFQNRGERFRESFEYIRQVAEDVPSFENAYGNPYSGMDLLPKPVGGKLPMLITGGSQQGVDWIAGHGDGWIIYPRNPGVQLKLYHDWNEKLAEIGRPTQPLMQPLYVDLTEDSHADPVPIHLGFRLGATHLKNYLKLLREVGINHIALNLRFNQAPIEDTIKRLADEILPEFTE
ncbi:LLM class oxidoreductase [Pontibacter sp. G13]|uniref:LLM class oxidoreductase n=1 Tax=Pontibacter sp. G13 TaxID=3074898 RepID=UPI00288ABE91|nr:LLM class oxidoreductase [Pontibacter sp. G13]WNJ19355.1 LLM class oxidoreductase [Pontibacter sp. G13]